MLNFEETQTQKINVEVSDEINKNSTVVHIAVLPVNEYDPEFKPDSIVWNVTENSKSLGLCVAIEDMDSGKDGKIDLSSSSSKYWRNYIQCNYTTSPGCPHQCRIGRVDREMTDTGLVFVQLLASDRGNPPRSAVATLTINITGVNDNQPYFEHQRKNVTLTEGQSATHFYHAVAIDKDVGYGSVVHYRMTNGNTHLFNVTKNGSVSAKPLWIDTKNKGHYEITVEAINEERPYTHCHFVNCTQIITVNIQDVNNHTPYFENNETSVLVPEDHSTSTVIAKVKAKDDDFTEKFNTVSYWIHPSSDHFLINPLNGDIYLTTQLDYENTTIYEIMVYASDSQLSWNSTEIHNATMKVTINVTDVNDNAPVFFSAFTNCSVMEGTIGPIDNCTIRANDVDSGKNGNVSYHIANSKLFDINVEGHIQLIRDLDYDNASVQHTYPLQVIANDQGIPPKSAKNTLRLPNFSDPDEDQHSLSPNLGPKCLQI